MKDIFSKVFINTFWLLFQRVFARLISFLLTVYLARNLETVDFGRLSFAISFVGLFLLFADLGIITLSIREVARNREGADVYIGNAVILKGLLSVFTFTIIIFALKLIRVPYETGLIVYLLAGYLLFENMGGLFKAVFQAYQKMIYVVLSDITEKAFLFLLCFILISKKYGITGIGLAYLFSGVLIFLANMLIVNLRFFRPNYKINLFLWKNILKESSILAIVALLSMVYFNIDIVMLGKMKGEEIAGRYSVSYHLFYTLAVLSGAFLSAVFPLLSRLSKESFTLLKKIYEKSFKVIIAMGIPLSLGCFLLADRIINLIFGPHYQQSAIVFKIFSPIIIFSFLNSFIGYFLTSVARQLLIAKMLTFTVITNVLLNLMLIPKYSYIGAASATVVSEILFSIIFYMVIEKEFKYLPLAMILKSIFSAILMGILVILLEHLKVNLIVIVPFAGIAYLILLYIIKYFDDEERIIIGRYFRFFKQKLKIF
ncbi:MAG: flippase [Candidatus Omnitrophica bacterium]|nr:flippase [Candidatus Omnitrophota bacterium]